MKTKERNHQVITEQPLLKEDGSLREPGWSKQLVQKYDRKAIKASKLKIKEWDYYIVLSDDFGVAFTISDIGYIGMQSVSFLNFKERWEHTESIISPLPLGKMKLPPDSSSGVTSYQGKRLQLGFEAEPGFRRISCNFERFHGSENLSCEILLQQPEMDSMVIATPWAEKKNAFYYNQKINCMPASGSVNFGGQVYEFNSETDFGTLDWGRGVWTYDNTWYWGSGNQRINGKPFGFNIGYGFGDTSAASENMLFYNGFAHKLDDVNFHFNRDNYMEPWRFSSSDGRFETTFHPIIDRAARINALVVKTDQHQVFGRMNGKVILDDGTVLKIKNLLCFAEDVHNRY
ncbi:MAG: DUF2804 domain-containing protein [Fastidiosipila sp.]|nr:DUF2804 domain-containing protein [Fastidiosipila sp.]